MSGRLSMLPSRCSQTRRLFAEIWHGLLEKPAGKKRTELERWLAGPEGHTALFAGRVLPFDEKACRSQSLPLSRRVAFGSLLTSLRRLCLVRNARHPTLRDQRFATFSTASKAGLGLPTRSNSSG